MSAPATAHSLVENIDDLVSLPGVFVRLNQLVESPDSTLAQIGEVIAQDPGLTARLLRMANSPMFGMRNQIDTINKAVTVIGMKRLRDLVLATSAAHAFDGIPNDLVSMDDFWMHSIRCGLAARFLAEQIKLPQADTLFVAGLLHDIGNLVMFKRIPEQCRATLLRSIEEAPDASLYLSERELIGFDHAAVGAELAEHWHLPPMYVETIRYHHEPELAKTFVKQTALVHLANSIAVCAELNTTDIDSTDAPTIHPIAWEITGLNAQVIAPTIEYIKAQSSSMHHALLE